VREVVVPQPPFARVPRARPAVRGAMNLRGRVIAMVDLPALVGASSTRALPRSSTWCSSTAAGAGSACW
jgi:purine-binding chemotaxis protein CheW